MAITHLFFNQNTQYGSELRLTLNQLDHGNANIYDVRETMIQMRDGDGSSAAHYQEVTDRYGFVGNTQAKAAFDEINACCIALDGVQNALNQLFAKLS